jgi:hypothetical protein
MVFERLMTDQEFQYGFNISISYVIGARWKPYYFLLYLDLRYLPYIVWDAIGYMLGGGFAPGVAS